MLARSIQELVHRQELERKLELVRKLEQERKLELVRKQVLELVRSKLELELHSEQPCERGAEPKDLGDHRKLELVRKLVLELVRSKQVLARSNRFRDGRTYRTNHDQPMRKS